MDRFWTKVDKSGECWLWTAFCDPDGYGRFRLGKRMEKAHRVAYMLEVGPIASGMQINHTCHTRACVNPTHLYEGTHADNMRDMNEAGRNAFASRTECKNGGFARAVVAAVFLDGEFHCRFLSLLVRPP